MDVDDLEATVRSRLRGLRVSMGLSLDDLAGRTHLSASTISRLETGKRTLSLDMLLPLCAALHTDLATLVETADDHDVVIRPTGTTEHGRTVWPLTRNRGAGGVAALKMRLEPREVADHDLQVHPGHDWFFVLAGTVLLTLGDRHITVHEGEAAEFSTMTPHGFRAVDGPAELITIFDRDGQHAHLGSHD